jgi:hypothetical protein
MFSTFSGGEEKRRKNTENSLMKPGRLGAAANAHKQRQTDVEVGTPQGKERWPSMTAYIHKN